MTHHHKITGDEAIRIAVRNTRAECLAIIAICAAAGKSELAAQFIIDAMSPDNVRARLCGTQTVVAQPVNEVQSADGAMLAAIRASGRAW